MRCSGSELLYRSTHVEFRTFWIDLTAFLLSCFPTSFSIFFFFCRIGSQSQIRCRVHDPCLYRANRFTWHHRLTGWNKHTPVHSPRSSSLFTSNLCSGWAADATLPTAAHSHSHTPVVHGNAQGFIQLRLSFHLCYSVLPITSADNLAS